MTLFEALFKLFCEPDFQPWLRTLPIKLEDWWLKQYKIEQVRLWQDLLEKIPTLNPSYLDLKNSVTIGESKEITSSQQISINQLLQRMTPWRKGPYSIYGVEIETEWRSDWKWQRVLPHLEDLTHRRILDVGCGNGYHLWRMLGEGAEMVVGVDPIMLFFLQFNAIQKIINRSFRSYFIPLPFEAIPALHLFDTVFSMGVLYHRRSPFDHLLQLKEQLRLGGQLVLETLVVEGDNEHVLVPLDRYAKMRNVYFIPSASALMNWLKKCGFVEIKLVDVNQTSLEEQRQTTWMQTESLADFLDPTETKTIEGYPRPLRAIITAKTSAN